MEGKRSATAVAETRINESNVRVRDAHGLLEGDKELEHHVYKEYNVLMGAVGCSTVSTEPT